MLRAETPASEKHQVLEDLVWSIFTSKEFVFQY